MYKQLQGLLIAIERKYPMNALLSGAKLRKKRLRFSWFSKVTHYPEKHVFPIVMNYFGNALRIINYYFLRLLCNFFSLISLNFLG